MADVDAILASREYRDRKGRTWWRIRGLWWKEAFEADSRTYPLLTHTQMRTLIERDRHRAVCPGLQKCRDHPVRHAVYWRAARRFDVYDAGPPHLRGDFPTLGAALDAARHMTGETP